MFRTMTAFAATALLATGATAAPTIYTDEAAFRADTSTLAFSLESFERADRISATSLAFGSGTTFDCRNCAPALSSRYPSDGTQTLGVNTGVTEPMTFTFASAVNAVSFDLSDFGTLGAGNLTLTVGGETVRLLDAYAGTTGNRLFFGFTSGDAFSSFTLTGGNSGDTAYFDRLRFAARDVGPIDPPPAVPEPATWAMMIGGFGLVGGAMRRAPKRRSVLA